MRKAKMKSKWYVLIVVGLLGLPVLAADDATLEDLYNAAGELIGQNNYTFVNFVADPNSDNPYGYREKAWGTYGDLADSSKTWSDPDHQEIVMSVTGLTSTMSYDVYVLAGGRTDTSDEWGIKAGFESENYALSTIQIGYDDSLTKYNLGLYYNGSGYPYQETQEDSTAACMYAVLVGVAASDENGQITVYVNDCEIEDDEQRTWFDGVLVCPSTQVSGPTPADGAVDLSDGDITLSWMGGTDPNGNAIVGMEGYYVYFGTDADALTCVNSDSLLSLDTTSYQVSLDYNTTYYWQIEEAMTDGLGGVYVPGEPNNIAGGVWSFSTFYYVPYMTGISEAGDYREGETVEITATYESTLSSVTEVTWYLDGVAIDPENDSNYSVTFTDTETVLTVTVAEETYGVYDCTATNSDGVSALSDAATVAAYPLWIWTGNAGTESWTTAENWDQQTAPELTDDLLIDGDGAVTYDGGDDECYYSGYLTLADDAELTIPSCDRFGFADEAPVIITITDDSKLTVESVEYLYLAHGEASVINQTGGQFYANVARGLFFTYPDGYATYNLSGGTLTVDFTSSSSIASAYWHRAMGYADCEDGHDQFNITGGSAYFTTTDGSERPFYMLRDSGIQVDSGLLSFDDFSKFSIGFNESYTSYEETAEVVLNGGQMTAVNAPIYVGDAASGQFEIHGGVLDVSTTDDQAVGICAGNGDYSEGQVIQTGGDVQLNGLEMVLGDSDGVYCTGDYTISGGNVSGVAALRLYDNTNFGVSGSAAGAIEIQEFDVEGDTSVTLTIDLDANGCSLITVGSDASDATYNGGAQLANLSIEVNALEDYQGGEGDVYNVMWVANNDMTGSDSITLINNTDMDFELQVVDATDYGYTGGQLLQIAVSFDPSKADHNGDGKVDLEDLAIFARAWVWQKD